MSSRGEDETESRANLGGTTDSKKSFGTLDDKMLERIH
jgi:hypothetical protein